MKSFVLAACTTLALPHAVTAGSYSEPKIEAPLIVEETTSSSGGAAIPLLAALMTVIAAAAN